MSGTPSPAPTAHDVLEVLRKRDQLVQQLAALEARNSQLRASFQTQSKAEKDRERIGRKPAHLDAPAGKPESDVALDKPGAAETDADEPKKRIGAIYDSCAAVVTANANLRAQVASLMYQQERLAGHLSQLTENDKTRIASLLQRRFLDDGRKDDDDDSTENEFEVKDGVSSGTATSTAGSGLNGFNLAGLNGKKGSGEARDRVSDLCPVDVSKLGTEWTRLFPVSRAAASLNRVPSIAGATSPAAGSAAVPALLKPPSAPLSTSPEVLPTQGLSRVASLAAAFNRKASIESNTDMTEVRNASLSTYSAVGGARKSSAGTSDGAAASSSLAGRTAPPPLKLPTPSAAAGSSNPLSPSVSPLLSPMAGALASEESIDFIMQALQNSRSLYVDARSKVR